MPPKVSVNICCYNSERFIKETIGSVLGQTFKDFEIIMIDDGSKDRTGEIIKSFKDPRIKYFYQENQGLSPSRNRAIELSSGEYIALLDHDDLWEPEKLELQVRFLDSNPGVGLVYSDAYYIDDRGEKGNQFFAQCSPHRGNVVIPLINGDFIPCLTAVIRKTVLDRTDLFHQKFKIAEEYELFLRLSLITEFDYVDRPLAGYRLHESNTSKDLERMYREEIMAVTDTFRGAEDGKIKKAVEERIARNNMIMALYLLTEKGRKSEARDMIGRINNPFLMALFSLPLIMPARANRSMFSFLRWVKKSLRMSGY